MDKILQSDKKVPVLYKFRYWTTKIVIINSTAYCKRTVLLDRDMNNKDGNMEYTAKRLTNQ